MKHLLTGVAAGCGTPFSAPVCAQSNRSGDSSRAAGALGGRSPERQGRPPTDCISDVMRMTQSR